VSSRTKTDPQPITNPQSPLGYATTSLLSTLGSLTINWIWHFHRNGGDVGRLQCKRILAGCQAASTSDAVFISVVPASTSGFTYIINFYQRFLSKELCPVDHFRLAPYRVIYHRHLFPGTRCTTVGAKRCMNFLVSQ